MGRPEHVGRLREEVGVGERLEGSLCPGEGYLASLLAWICSSLFATPPFLVRYQVLLSSSHIS